MTTAKGGVGSRIGLPVLLGVILLWTVVPLAWMVLSSFKPTDELTTSTPTLMFAPTLEHYDALFSGGNNIVPYIRNSLLAGFATGTAVGGSLIESFDWQACLVAASLAAALGAALAFTFRRTLLVPAPA